MFSRRYMCFLVFFLVFTSCMGKGNVLPEKELATLPAVKIMELAAEEYQANEFDRAIYYYEYVRKNLTNDYENLAWATYEIGFIKYQQGKYKEALSYFDEVITINSPNNAPLILAAQMKERIQKKISKK